MDGRGDKKIPAFLCQDDKKNWFFEEEWSEVAGYLAASEANLCRGSIKHSYS